VSEGHDVLAKIPNKVEEDEETALPISIHRRFKTDASSKRSVFADFSECALKREGGTNHDDDDPVDDKNRVWFLLSYRPRIDTGRGLRHCDNGK
jgi:hypothetical protein